jgi:hypothetical protein
MHTDNTIKPEGLQSCWSTMVSQGRFNRDAVMKTNAGGKKVAVGYLKTAIVLNKSIYSLGDLAEFTLYLNKLENEHVLCAECVKRRGTLLLMPDSTSSKWEMVCVKCFARNHLIGKNSDS